MTQIWMRNPKNYIRQVVEVDHRLLVWDRGVIIKNGIDPWQFNNLHFGTNKQWRTMIVGSKGTVEITEQCKEDNPAAVYPTFTYGESLTLLENIMASNVGEDPIACAAPNLDVDERPVLGQEHRVVITEIPDARMGTSRVFYRELRELQEEYPECILHLHGSYNFRTIFGLGYQSGDYEPRTYAAKKMIVLPNGKVITVDRAALFQQWVNVLGMSVSNLKVPAERCIFNIRSCIWASKNYDKDFKFKSNGDVGTDPSAPVHQPQASSGGIYKGKPQTGDKITCNTCSLANSCKYFRVDAVCSIPGSETSVLAKFFGSRDSGRIIDALGTVLGTQVERAEEGRRNEQMMGDLDPQVTKLLNDLFNNGVKLAKLVDPSLTKPAVAINVGNGAQVAGATPNAIMSDVMRTLEKSGIAREDITPEMVASVLTKMQEGEPLEIEGQVVSGPQEDRS